MKLYTKKLKENGAKTLLTGSRQDRNFLANHILRRFYWILTRSSLEGILEGKIQESKKKYIYRFKLLYNPIWKVFHFSTLSKIPQTIFRIWETKSISYQNNENNLIFLT